jgi:hypothetical protein
MSQYVALSSSRHRDAGVLVQSYAFAAEQAIVPVTLEEVGQVLPTMPLVFVPRWQSEGFQLSALQALEGGNNLYVHTNGRWIGGYRPAWYRAHPFRLIADESSDRHMVCVDESAEAFHADGLDADRPLFNIDGEPSEFLQNVMQFLQQWQKSQRLTDQLVDQLNDAGVIVPWRIRVGAAEGEAGRELEGVYHINENKWRALTDETLGLLTRSGAAAIAYAQLLSEHRLKGLARLYDLRHQAQKQASPAEVDLDELFGDDDDGNLSF